MTTAYNTKPHDVRVAIGPAAGSCCYEVGADVIDPFRTKFPGHDLFTETRTGHACINLLEANRNQLIAAGVEPENIAIAPLCTMCRTDLFFSYRREKNVLGKVGRLMSVIGRQTLGEKGKRVTRERKRRPKIVLTFFPSSPYSLPRSSFDVQPKFHFTGLRRKTSVVVASLISQTRL